MRTVSQLIAERSASGANAIPCPVADAPKRFHRLGRSIETGVSFIRSYSSTRTGTPTESSPIRRARASGHSTSMFPPGLKDSAQGMLQTALIACTFAELHVCE